MSNNRETNKKQAAKAQQKKANFLPILAATAVVICIAVVVLSKQNSGTDNGTGVSSGDFEETRKESSEAVTISSGESLVIPTADIATDASFFPVEVNGTRMEVIAVKDSRGNIRTAFNTCQVCYDSGRGYYKQAGSNLVCQNCGNRFSMDQVGRESGGCNPWPIFAGSKTETDGEIAIPYDFLVESQAIFANWKGKY